MKKLVKLIAVMLLACLCLTACGSADGDIATIEKNGKIVVGITE